MHHSILRLSHSSSPRAATLLPLSLFFSVNNGDNHRELLCRGAASSVHPKPRRCHRWNRTVVLYHLEQAIEPGPLQSTRNSPIPRSGRRGSSSIPAATDSPFIRRGLLLVPGHLRRRRSGDLLETAPPSSGPRRRGAPNALTRASGGPLQRPRRATPSRSHRVSLRRARHLRVEHFPCVPGWFASLAATSASLVPPVSDARVEPLGSRSGDVRYDEFSDKFFCSFSQVRDDDVSKVTLPAWPGQGYGRRWLSSGLLVQFVSCPYSDVFDLLYDLDLCIVYLYLDSLESLL
nr:uncharacterized protein LOC127328825 [Lolium perenne]